MEDHHRKLLLLSLSILLLMIAAGAFFGYVSQGIAYSAVLGLPGREQDLQRFAVRGLPALAIALLCEALAVGILSWLFVAVDQKVWTRLFVCVAFAGVADLLTFEFVRP
jgi:hypothetical protein